MERNKNYYCTSYNWLADGFSFFLNDLFNTLFSRNAPISRINELYLFDSKKKKQKANITKLYKITVGMLPKWYPSKLSIDDKQ